MSGGSLRKCPLGVATHHMKSDHWRRDYINPIPSAHVSRPKAVVRYVHRPNVPLRRSAHGTYDLYCGAARSRASNESCSLKRYRVSSIAQTPSVDIHALSLDDQCTWRNGMWRYSGEPSLISIMAGSGPFRLLKDPRSLSPRRLGMVPSDRRHAEESATGQSYQRYPGQSALPTSHPRQGSYIGNMPRLHCPDIISPHARKSIECPFIQNSVYEIDAWPLLGFLVENGPINTRHLTPPARHLCPTRQNLPMWMCLRYHRHPARLGVFAHGVSALIVQRHLP